ncbi:MAG: bifunctional heptose 7-phosphate kinase/heptose 1-phosphate adenyltransferase [Pirellulaceae bacterium]
MAIHDLTKRIDELRGRRVLVLGDLILDRYTWGNAERVSPEAPVLVLRADEHEVRPGGAASVAMLLRHLDATVMLAGVVGDDAAGQALLKILHDEQVDQDLVCCVSGRPTTTKERFVGRAANRHPHQILRVDHETREAIHAETVSRLRDGILQRITEHTVIIISDYGKGVCTPELLNAIIHAAHDCGIPVVVDPARITDYSRYRHASLVTPNREEAELATDIPIESSADALNAGRTLVEQAGIGAAFITLDRDGIAVVDGGDEESGQHIEPAVARDVYDITGAGDMVVAVAGLCQAAGWPLGETARLANMAAGLEIEQLGIAPVTWGQIAERYAAANACNAGRVARPEALRRAWSGGDKATNAHRHAHPCGLSVPPDRAPDKIATLPRLSQLVAEYRTAGKSIVFTNGCFDLLHVGHVTYLQEAAELGDVLIVAINSDAGVRRLKGPQRPVIGQSDRAAILASLACVDHVLIFDEPTPHRLLDGLRPDVLVKGGTTREVVGRELVEAYGGRVCTTPAAAGTSTTDIITRLARCTNQALLGEG